MGLANTYPVWARRQASTKARRESYREMVPARNRYSAKSSVRILDTSSSKGASIRRNRRLPSNFAFPLTFSNLPISGQEVGQAVAKYQEAGIIAPLS